VAELEIRGSWRVSLPELSALAIRSRGDGGTLELLAVGDKLCSISAGEAQPSVGDNLSGDLSDAVARWTWEPEGDSQWEGLAADGIGRAFVLQEHPGDEEQPSHVFVFAPDLRERVGVIALLVDGAGEEWREAWSEDMNARAEALALLRGGHLLVAKQKDPVRLIEFGPKGNRAAGLGSSRFLEEGEPFQCPPEEFAEYEVLHSWGVAKDGEDELRSVNDLAVFEGSLYAVSRDSRRITRLEADVGPTEESVGVERSWPIPATVGQPEGLVVRSGLVPIVADDVKSEEDRGGPNIFLLGDMAHPLAQS
jgi:hypothetical protein